MSCNHLSRIIVAVASFGAMSANAPQAADNTNGLPARVASAAALAALGEKIFFDPTLSEPHGTACASCHDPARAFASTNGATIGIPRGSRENQFGTRKSPRLAYAMLTPPFSWIEKNGKRVARGGLFWDGRVDTLAEQAKQPFFQSNEMNLKDTAMLRDRVRASANADAMRAQFGAGVFDDPDRHLNAVASALEAFQRTARFAPFSSKFDAVQRGEAKFTEQEERGYGLFTIRQKGNCAECHTVNVDSKNPRDSLFTDFGYHAVAAPRNTAIPANARADHRDLGLCASQRFYTERKKSSEASIAKSAADEFLPYCGQFRTPSLRNVAVSGPYFHNARFASLRDAVAFYATRDTEPEQWYPAGKKFDDMPTELHHHIDVDTPPYNRAGKRPQLKNDEIDDIVAFLQTLTDGYSK